MNYIDAFHVRWAECLAETTPQERDHYARFYSDAYVWCQGVAAELWPDDIDLYTGRIADCVATLSPLKAWDQNLVIAERACEVFRDTGEVTSDIGAMKARATAATHALQGFGPGTGPKVSAFAANIRGDWHTRVTIDRHMLAMIAPDLVPTPKRVGVIEDALLNACIDIDSLAPATVQAVLWGWWRQRKGLPTYV